MVAVLVQSMPNLILFARHGANVVDVRLGVGRHIQVVDPSGFQTIFINHYAGEILFLWAIAMVKCSILAFYWRIWKVSTLKIPIFLVGAIVIVWLLASVGCFAFQLPPSTSDFSRLLPQSFNVHLSRKNGWWIYLVTASLSLGFSWQRLFPRLSQISSSWQCRFPISGSSRQSSGRRSCSLRSS